MGKRQFIVFMLTFLLIGVAGLAFGGQVLADLRSFYQNPAYTLSAELVLSPDPLSRSVNTEVEGVPLTVARQVVDERLESLHLVGTYQVVPQGDQLLVKLRQNENMPYIASVLSSVGEIEFINGGSESPPIGRIVETGIQANLDRDRYQMLFTGQEIRSVAAPDSATGQIFYQLDLEPAVTERLGDYIKESGRDYICMVMDGYVLSCSLMYHWSGDTLEILPSLSSGTAVSLADLAIFLDSGPLPAPIEVEFR